MPQMTAADARAWGHTTYQALNLSWQSAPTLRKGTLRILGRNANRSAFVDCTLDPVRRQLRSVSVVCPIQVEYTILLTLTLALLDPATTLPEADAWLKVSLDQLPRDKPGKVRRMWHGRLVTLTTTSVGLLTMVL